MTLFRSRHSIRRGGVLIGVGPVLEPQADVQHPLPSYPRFFGTHYSKHLSNGADVVLHPAGANVLTSGTDFDTTVFGSEGGEDQDGFPVQQYY